MSPVARDGIAASAVARIAMLPALTGRYLGRIDTLNAVQSDVATFTHTEASVAAVRPSTLIAEALVERQSPREIVARACALGLSDPKLEVILAACGSTAGTAVLTPVTRTEHKASGGICQAR